MAQLGFNNAMKSKWIELVQVKKTEEQKNQEKEEEKKMSKE
jgi:hypothetical protein